MGLLREPLPAGTANTAASFRLMTFGGNNHETYLGCLNCSEYASDSVSNSYGAHGSADRSKALSITMVNLALLIQRTARAISMLLITRNRG